MTKTISALMSENLQRVFNERDDERRARAIEELYAPEAVFYEQEGEHSGRDAIIAGVAQLMRSLPPTLQFVEQAAALQNHAMGKLHWRASLPDGTPLTGSDVAQFDQGLIKILHVFIDPPG